MSVGITGSDFKVDFIGLGNFEWYSENEVGNIGILVLWSGLFVKKSVG